MIAFSLDPQAEKELEDAFVYYREQGGSKLAEAFVAEFERVALLLCANTLRHASWRGTAQLSAQAFPVFAYLWLNSNWSADFGGGPSASFAWVLAGSKLIDRAK